MNITDTKQVKTLFGAALDVKSDQLDSFLTQACQGDNALREEVLSLLNAYRSASGFIEPVDYANCSADPVSEGNQVTDGDLDRFGLLMLNEKPGDSIDRYRLVQVIGEGGYGIVFRAEQQQPIRRIVALKLIKASMESDPIRLLFETERQTLALMDHPNIAKLLDAGTTAEGRLYFVMELVAGIPVTRYCDEHRLTIRQRVALFITICRAVHHAHQKGIIHRDLKPSNILVAHSDAGAVPKVIDFGVSQLISDCEPGEDQLVFGTPRYMSPEQVSAAQGTLDTRSDVYSLGAVLYEILCGVPAIQIDDQTQYTFAQAKRIFNANPIVRPSTRMEQLATLPSGAPSIQKLAENRQIAPHAFSAMLRADLDSILSRALDASRNSRYDSVAALADDLQRYLDHRPVMAVPPQFFYLCRRFCARNRIVVSLSGVIALVLLAALLTTSMLYINARRSRDRSIFAEKITSDSKAQAVSQLQHALLLQARAGRNSRLPNQRIDSLNAIAQAAKIAPSMDLRNEAIASLALPDVEFLSKWDHLDSYDRVVLTGDMERFAVSDRTGAIRICKTSDRSLITELPGTSKQLVTDFRFDPTANFLKADYSGNRHVRKIWDLRTRTPIFQTDTPAVVSFSNDGRTFAVGTSGGSLEIRSLPSGRLTRTISLEGEISHLEFQPGDQNIAVSIQLDGIRLVSIDGTSVTAIPAQLTDVAALAWHPDGERLAITGSDQLGGIEVVNVNTKSMQTIMKGHISRVTGLVFTHNGRFLLSGGWDGRVRLWDAFSGTELLSLEGSGDDLQISEDDARISFAYGPDHPLYRLLKCEACRVIQPSSEDGAIWSTDVSPDGQYLAGATKLGVRLWQLKTGKSVGFITCPGPRTVLFDRDGKSIFASTAQGVKRWPLSRQLGHQDPFAEPVNEGSTAAMAMNADKSNILFGRADGTLFFGESDNLAGAQIIGGHSVSPRFVAVSPDGCWAASSARFEKGNSFRIWDLKKGSIATKLESDQGHPELGDVAFSPDGKSLVTSDHLAYRWYSVGDWKLLHVIGRKSAALAGCIAFSPDGQLVALAGEGNAVTLAAPATGETLATLDTPIPHSVYSLRFSHDSTQLITSGYSVIAWNLSQIQKELASMNLEWPSRASRSN